MLCVAAISFPWACAVAIDSAANQAPRPGPRSDSDADPEGACLNKISWNFFGFLPKILQKIAIFQRFSSNFAPILIKISRNFAEYSKKWWAIPKMLNFQWILADISWIPTEFWPNSDVKNSIYSIARQSDLLTLGGRRSASPPRTRRRWRPRSRPADRSASSEACGMWYCESQDYFLLWTCIFTEEKLPQLFRTSVNILECFPMICSSGYGS